MANIFYRDEEKVEYIREIKKDRKTAKNVLAWGLYGLTLMGIDYFSGALNDIFNTPVSAMDLNQLAHFGIFTLSSIGAAGGGAIYGITYLMSPRLNKGKSIEDNITKQE